jgi:hypothetical protein
MKTSPLYLILDHHVIPAADAPGRMAEATYHCHEGDKSWTSGPPPLGGRASAPSQSAPSIASVVQSTTAPAKRKSYGAKTKNKPTASFLGD